jgi:hypothetical protein
VQELAPVLAAGDVPDQVELLAGGAEGALQRVVVVGRHDELVAVAVGQPQPPRQARQQLVHRARRVVGVEQLVELVVQRPGAQHHLHVLGDPQQVEQLALRVAEERRQVGASSAPLRR